MSKKPVSTFAMTSALWLALLPMQSHANEEDIDTNSASNQAQIFLSAGSLTSYQPLNLSFHPQQLTLEENNIKALKRWIKKIKKANIPIHIYSYATPPKGRRDMTEQSGHHMAMRKAFNRALNAKNLLESEGISDKMIAMHAIGPADNNPADQLHITLRQN